MKKILVPVDFSDASENAFQYALNISHLTNKELVLLHCGDDTSGAESRMKSMASTDTVDQAMPLDFIASTDVFGSSMVQKLVNSHHIRLIIMGSVGTSAGDKFFGSNALDIIEGANCPVLLVPPGNKFSGLKKIAYASDLAQVEHEMGRVVSFARMFNAAISLLHVSPVFPDLGEVENMNMHRKTEQLRRMHQYANIFYHNEEMPRDNEVQEGVKKFLGERNDDLLVMFHSKRSTFDAFFDPGYTSGAVRRLGVPVLVYPKE
jgi:nucleotide-binding universal stress UspA family protein